jgi:two-component system response regulator AtoC
MPKILIIDDEPAYLRYLQRILPTDGHEVHVANSGAEAITKVKDGLRPDLTLLDIMMPELDGHQTLTGLLKVVPDLRVMILSALDHSSHVVKSIKAGAMDYLTKESTPAEILASVRKCLEWEGLPARTAHGEPIREALVEEWVFHSPPMREIQRTAQQVADLPVKVLLLGESGVGKDVIARYIHCISRRRNRPFIKVNCAALPHELIESELFGHEKGAFTGAQHTQKGKLELAEKGTIFLDEIGDFSLATQAKLLQALEDNEFMRLGGEKTIRINSRIIVATNRNLEVAVNNGKFRRDLYYRLFVVNIMIPPLRERREDITPLIRSFLDEFRREFGADIPFPDDSLMELFHEYRWPGNVRELKNIMKKYAIFQDGEAIAAEIRHKLSDPVIDEPLPPKAAVQRAGSGISLKDASRIASLAAEKELILEALEKTNWNRKKAAALLDVSYKTFRNKIKELGLEKPPTK